MAYELGTASDYLDLLARLKDFLSNSSRTTGSDPNIDELSAMPAGQVWTVNRYNNYSGSEYELLLQGQGTGGTDQIYVGIKTYRSDAADYFNWKLNGYTGYQAAATWEQQSGTINNGSGSIEYPRLLLWNDSIYYWFVGNGRRFIVVAKVSTVYQACYMGWLLPYGVPSQLPYPLVIGGCLAYNNDSATYQRWSGTSDYHGGPFNPWGGDGDYATLKLLHGDWLGFAHAPYYAGSYLYYRRGVWPYIHSRNDGLWSSQAHHIFNTLTPNLDGSYPIFPLVLVQSSPNFNVFGELEGCFAVPGRSIGSEDTITIGGNTYIVFQNTFRTTYNDFWALKKE